MSSYPSRRVYFGPSLDDDPYTRSSRAYRPLSPSRKYDDILDRSASLYRNLDLARPIELSSSFDRRAVSVVAQQDVLSLEAKVASKEAKIAQLEREVRTYQDLESQQTKTVQQLKDRLNELERSNRDLSNVHAKADLAASTLQQENRLLQDKILDLETRLRRFADDHDFRSQSAAEWQRNYEELNQFLSRSLFPSSFGTETRSHEAITRKMSEFFDEQAALRAKVHKLEDAVAMKDDECRQSKESMRRILDDFDKSKKYIASADILKDERDAAIRKQEQLQDQLKQLEHRMISNQQVFENTNSELRNKQSKISEIDSVARKHAMQAQATEQELKAFKESLSILLSDGYSHVPATDESIKSRIRELSLKHTNVEQAAQTYDEKIKKLSEQLEEQAKLHKNAIQRARKAEDDVDRLMEKLRGAEGELVATDILKHGLRTDKEKYLAFLEKMAETMKLDAIARQLGVDLNGDALLARAEQLVKLEEDYLNKRGNAALMTLQRQLKETKKQAENKDLHIDLLRKKLSTMESDIKHDLELDRDHSDDTHRKLNRELDRVQKRLIEADRTIQSMRTESVENKTLKIACEEQRKAIESLEAKVRELDAVRTKQARRIAAIRQEKDSADYELQHGLTVTESTMQNMSIELQRAQTRLDEVAKREKQLLDLRQVIARMLGLDINTLAVADYEIISRLEAIIQGQHELALSANSLLPGHGGQPTRVAHSAHHGILSASHHHNRPFHHGLSSSHVADPFKKAFALESPARRGIAFGTSSVHRRTPTSATRTTPKRFV